MKILVLGSTGMLGHKLMQILSRRFDVIGTVRGRAFRFEGHPILGGLPLIDDVNAENFDSITSALASAKPNIVINCIGIVKQHPNAKDPLKSITINSLFPHRLAQLCQAAGAKMIHISTDCVFSGRKGDYTEKDYPDAEDLYGRTKLLGEVMYPDCLTLRTSIIGREMGSKLGLIEWFISQRRKKIHGYAHAIYTGFTTLALADLIGYIIEVHPDLQGLWHVSSNPISKYDLLGLVNQELDLEVIIEKDESFACDRSLNSARFREATGFEPPSWEYMVSQMADDAAFYKIQ
jgi:dTDP-4-dehydrorhamnose reductase